MTTEQTEHAQGFCPAHFALVKESSTATAEIKTLSKSHDRMCNIIEKLRDDLRDRMPPRTVLIITALSSGFFGLLCIVVTHFLATN